MTIRYPGVRTQVLSAVESLADREYQERVWIRHELPHPGYYDELDLSVHTLFDDAAVLPDPASAVGTVLHAQEVGPLAELGAVFGPLIDDLGDQPDAVYLADPRWDDVVRAAVKAYEVMRAQG
jgi:hypothetical protein